MEDALITIEEVETTQGLAVKILINSSPEDMDTDHLVFSWCILKLLKAYTSAFPDRVAAMRRVIDITMQIEKEFIN